MLFKNQNNQASLNIRKLVKMFSKYLGLFHIFVKYKTFIDRVHKLLNSYRFFSYTSRFWALLL